MSARTLQLGFSLASICVATIAFVIVLDASLVNGDESRIDLSRGRDVALVFSVAFLAVSSFLFLRSLRLRRPTVEAAAEEVVDEAVTEVQEAVEAADAAPSEETPNANEDHFHSLSIDEIELYEMIADAGGEMLQMNIVSSKVFSKAKVTRLLDKLESKGLVVRERHGMTNRVRIIR